VDRANGRIRGMKGASGVAIDILRQANGQLKLQFIAPDSRRRTRRSATAGCRRTTGGWAGSSPRRAPLLRQASGDHRASCTDLVRELVHLATLQGEPEQRRNGACRIAGGPRRPVTTRELEKT
jgi:hypothetical protein